MDNNRTNLVTKDELRDENAGFLVRIVQNTSIQNPLRAWTIRIFSIIKSQNGQEFLIPGVTANLYRPSFGRVELRQERMGDLMPLLVAAEQKVVQYAQKMQDEENAAQAAAPRSNFDSTDRSFNDGGRDNGGRGRGNRGSRRNRDGKWGSIDD